MTEAEFGSYRRAMALDPGPEVKIAHLLKMAVPILATLANSWGAKFRITAEHLDPWETARDKAHAASAAADRVNLWAASAFGAPGN